MKNFTFLFIFILSFFCTALKAYDFPGLRQPNNFRILLLPDTPGKSVSLEFDKRDLNGYIGTDPIVLTVVSPSGSNICEVTVPDDGDTDKKWLTGPRQRVKISFVPQEKGIYSILSNSSSNVDISYWFDQAEQSNTIWAIVQDKPRFMDGKLDVFLALPPRKTGEAQQLTLQFPGLGGNPKIHHLQVRENDKILVNDFSFRKGDTVSTVAINRSTAQGVLQFTAANFGNTFWLFPGYGEILIAPEKSFAERFYACYAPTYFKERSVEYALPFKTSGAAFAPGKKFRLSMSAGKEFRFETTVNGQKITLSSAEPVAEFTVSAGSPFVKWDWSQAPAGKLAVQEITGVPEILSPASGAVQSTAAPALSWTPVSGSTAYQVIFRHADSSKTVTVDTRNTSLNYQEFAGKLTPGVWFFSVRSGNAVCTDERFFIIPEPAKTQLAYLYDFSPARDSFVNSKPSRLSVRFSGKKAHEFDFEKSFFTVNGKKYPAVSGGMTTVVLPVKEGVLQSGRNLVTLTLTDKADNVQQCAWSFDLNNSSPRTVSADDNGNIFYNGSPYFPVIYYGYMGGKMQLEEEGFNCWLLNAVPNKAMLDKLLKRNLKVLDSGCAFKDKTAEQIRKAVPAIAAHPARIGMWSDEIDVHRSEKWIADHLKIFDVPNGGWKGVCSCNVSLYGKMAEIGDYLMIDCYVGGDKIFNLDSRLKKARRDAGKKPVMVLVSGFTYNDPALTAFSPSAADAEYQAFATLRHRINALGLYQCGSFRMECYPEMWKQVTQIYRNFSALAFIAYGKDVSDQFKITSANGKPVFRAFRLDDRIYVIAQNQSFTPAPVNLQTTADIADPSVKVLFENRMITMKNGSFTDAMSGAGTHIYVFKVR
ncbi:MAG: hypothetical protein E7057_08135 [Lentisphaerae bacterium]|nr:hypothetical protein [Lentisphaerota bacterium]